MKTLSQAQTDWFHALQQHRQEGQKILEQPAFKQIWRTIVGMYSEQAHFLFELLQNANDVKATRVRFQLSPEGLIFAHNGKVHFSVSDPALEETHSGTRQLGHLNAITSIGNSAKRGNQLTQEAQIGKFGIGFKSVFQYTRNPEIYDAPFFFRLERYIVPMRLESDHPEREAGETLFYFPFDHPEKSPESSYQEILRKIQSLGYPNLFLSHVAEIDWETASGESGSYRKRIHKEDQQARLRYDELHYVQQVEGEKQTQHLHLFSDQLVEEETGNAHSFSLGFFMNEKSTVHAQQNVPVYCFFPTRVQANLPFIVHAPFLLTDNREGIKEDNEWNESLIAGLYKLLNKALLYLCDKKLLDMAVLKALPLEPYQITDERFDGFYASLKSVFRGPEPLLPTLSGNYVSRFQAVMGESKVLMDLLSDAQLSKVRKQKGAQWVLPGVNRNTNDKALGSLFAFCRWELDIEEFSAEAFLGQLHQGFLAEEGEEWIERFYHFLARQRALWPWARKKALILTEAGQIMAAEDKKGNPVVYLPSPDRRETPYPTVKHSFAEDKTLRKLFQELGIKEPEANAEIFHFILPAYETEAVQRTAEEYEVDFELLYEYYQSLDPYEQKGFVEKLQQYYLVKVRTAHNGEAAWIQPAKRYFYLQNEVNQRFFAPYLANGGHGLLWLDQQYYQNLLGENANLEFLNALDLELSPTYHRPNILDNDTQNPNSVLLERNLEMHDYTRIEGLYEKRILGLEDFLQKMQNQEDSIFLWELVRQLMKKPYEWGHGNMFEGIFNFFYHRSKEVSFDSKIKVLLQKYPWMYNAQGQKCKPAAMTFKDLAPYDDWEDAEELIDALGIASGVNEYGEQIDQLPEDIQEHIELGQLAQDAGITKEEMLHLIQEKKRKERLREQARQNQGRKRKAEASVEEETTEEQDRHDADEFTPPVERSEAFKERLEKRKKELEIQFEEEELKLEQIIAYEEIASSSARYSFAWMKAMLAWEVLKSAENSKDSQTLTLRFSEVKLDPDSGKTLILGRPNNYIPNSIEDLGDIPLKLVLETEDKLLKIEVVSVKDRKLSARVASEELLEGIKPEAVRYAEVVIQDPIFILEALKNQFDLLEFEEEDSLLEELPEHMEFVFGPPGTGKTTTLADDLITLGRSSHSKTLVLTPTNKAADVLVQKIMSRDESGSFKDWLHRFGTTGESAIDEAGLLVDKRDNILHEDSFVVVTTIARLPYDGFQVGFEETGELREIPWNYVVFDEASMITLPSILYAIHKLKGNVDYCEFTIAGDPFQIQPVVHVDEWKDENIYTMVQLKDFVNPETVPYDFGMRKLTTQYRSIPSIGTLFSQFTYGGILAHNRSDEAHQVLPAHTLDLAPVTLLDFPVNRHGIYKSMRLKGTSSYQVYSAILAVELMAYFSDLLKGSEVHWRLGIICPYRAQAELTEKLAERRGLRHESFDFHCGTVHGFQGDECEIIIALLNPTPGMSSSDRAFINKQNILNVAISRPRDYLIIMSPDQHTWNIDNLWLLKKLKKLARDTENNQFKHISAEKIEELLFQQSNFISDNAFSTSHQLVNIYGNPDYHYEVRLNDEAIDIQLKS